MTVVEQEADHNQVGFLDRFTEALYYYSTMFDSLEACAVQPEKALAEMYIQRDMQPEGYCVEEKEGCLTLGWHSRPLIAASAWQAAADVTVPLGIVNHNNDQVL
ncbi:hypothetical protein FNV43_RR16625 [Rhamnella rubrinervis]|uniref:Uncharacterized protein n=1 Tax=Rhamnella rubrinervis TaxID=2594499 RepID=A0A8K0GZ74_9ROSA|nr:hypothetical protein FNV43_RR16625 [Rhamnella rubrinervis]